MKRRYYLFLILIILVFHIFLNYQILEKNSFARLDDEAVLIIDGLGYYRMIFVDHSINKLDHILELYGQCHPHFFEFIESLSWKILSLFKIIDINSMILVTNSIFFIILLLSTYKIGSIIYNENVGILSVVLISMFPLVFGHSRVALRDYPLMCMISLGFWMLLKTNKFSSSLYSIFSGIVFGLAQLTKETAFIFIIGPLIYYFIKSYSVDNKKKALFNFTVTLTFFLILSGIVYFRLENLHAFKRYFNTSYYIRNYPDPFYYLKNFIEMVGPFILIISLPLLIQYLVNIKKREIMFLIWLVIPIILFSISPNKSVRFIFPILPAFALIVSSEIDNINLSKIFKKVFCIILISISGLQYAFFSAGILNKRLKMPYFEVGILSIVKNQYPFDSVKLSDIFRKEAKDNNISKNKNILFLFCIGEIHWPLCLDISLHKLPFYVSVDMLQDEAGVLDTYGVDWSEKILTADYIIDKTGVKNIPNCAKHISDGLEEGFVKYKNKFELIADIKLPLDNSTVSVYKKISLK